MAKKTPTKILADSLSQHYDTWVENTLRSSAAEMPLRKAEYKTSSGLEIPPLSIPTPKALDANYYVENLGFPGEFPFTRGIYPTMYRSRPWTIRQYAGFGTPGEANKRYRYLLGQGSSGLSVAFDLPTQMGRDCDDPLAAGEVGRVGVSISSLSDMEQLFDEIPLDRISTSMTINATAAIVLAFYLGVATKRNIPWSKLRGTIQNDILKEYIARGTYIYPPLSSLRLVTDVFEFCRDQVPGWNTISISGYHIREAGATAVQEVAFTMANAVTYVEAALKRGLDIDSFAPRLAFFFNCHNNFFEEIAKFRAARRIWARMMKERFGAKESRSLMLRFHTQTAGSTLTAQQPEVNIVRTTLQALAAVLGGTQSLHTNAYDEALCLPTEKSALLALRTQQVIAGESGVADFVDPLAGSYAVEQLTDGIEASALEYLVRIEAMGGMIGAIERGYPQREIEEASFRYQREIETKQREIVGVNVYTESAGEGLSGTQIMKVDPLFEVEQKKRLAEVRASRNQGKATESMSRLSQVTLEGKNVMPTLVDAVMSGVTLGEISNVFRQHFGEYQGVS